MSASAQCFDAPVPGEGGYLPRGTHSGIKIVDYVTPGFTVSEHHYDAGLRIRGHAHETPFIYADVPCSSRPLDQRTIDQVEIGFSPIDTEHPQDVTDGNYSILHIDLTPSHAAELIGEPNVKRDLVCEDPYVYRLALALRTELQHSDSLTALQVAAIVCDMASSIVRISTSTSTIAPRWMKRIKNEIAERYNEEISLEELATSAQVHPVQVSRIFRRCHGETLRDYIRRLRIQEACRLLKSGSHSIAEIALETGYYDESHFAKAFKRVTGATPGQYRGEFQRA